jgi:hypothetical protein
MYRLTLLIDSDSRESLVDDLDNRNSNSVFYKVNFMKQINEYIKLRQVALLRLLCIITNSLLLFFPFCFLGARRMTPLFLLFFFIITLLFSLLRP